RRRAGDQRAHFRRRHAGRRKPHVGPHAQRAPFALQAPGRVSGRFRDPAFQSARRDPAGVDLLPREGQRAGPQRTGACHGGCSPMNPLVQLTRLGQSVWLDFITRDLLRSGELSRLIVEDGLRGMTTNPTIFEKAIAGSTLYDGDIRRVAAGGANPGRVIESLAVADVRTACDAFRPLYETTEGRDGFVSIEVSPELAYDTEATVVDARRLWQTVDRPNLMVKIPGTKEGLPAIERCLTEGMSINVTLLFGLERYAEVREAYLSALEQRVQRGQPVDRIASVASFFVSRVDSRVDKELAKKGDAGKALSGQIAIANAQVAYADFTKTFCGDRWEALAKHGARVQRPLWASTSTKDPNLSDVLYVEA